MQQVSTLLKQCGMWILVVLRLVVGLTVMKTGYDLAVGSLYADRSIETDPLTPLFIIVLGAYFAFSSLLRRLFPEEKKE